MVVIPVGADPVLRALHGAEEEVSVGEVQV